MLRSCIRLAKQTTGLVGVPVVSTFKSDLTSLYNQTLKALEPIPSSAIYRQSLEELTKKRLAVVSRALDEDDYATVEQEIGCGQVEELILQAKDELSLIQKYIEWKPWEPLQTQAPPGQWTPFSKDFINTPTPAAST